MESFPRGLWRELLDRHNPVTYTLQLKSGKLQNKFCGLKLNMCFFHKNSFDNFV